MSKIAPENLQQLVLYLDSKEKDPVKQLFQDRLQGFDVEVKPCSVGDFWICVKHDDDDTKPPSPLLVIERKTWEDYITSLENNHISEQRSRLLETGHKAAFLVEGPRTACVGYKRRNRWDAEAFLRYSQVRDGIGVLYADDMEESLRTIEQLMNKMRDKAFLELKGGSKTFAECQKLQKKSKLTAEECYAAQLAQVPGVTVSFARKLMEQYPNMVKLSSAIYKRRDETILAIANTMLTEKRRFGDMKARAFVQFISGQVLESDAGVKMKKKKKPTKKKSDTALTKKKTKTKKLGKRQRLASEQEEPVAKRRMIFLDDDSD